ncbi:DNA polymerase III subunit alpha [Terasakiella sp. SH-1]|uniref:DNA polymerase III subunit alpha n=1 Tax=Terasakiella sp. SH-1 TaxID=2560057 RepID=UPI001072F5F9|nr:DNA polymerase III subunit alpha [Terasakiella sp. SH-1]
MSHADFVHLRMHTAYSLSEGAVRIKSLPKWVDGERMPAIAMTDTNNMFGGLEFSQTMSGAGIQPIIGCQLSITAQAIDDSSAGLTVKSVGPTTPDQIVLLAQDDPGYRNLMKLVSRAFLNSPEGEDPQVLLEDVLDNNEGLILLTGGHLGPIGQMLLQGHKEKAESLLSKMKAAFPNRMYVELQRHNLPEQDQIEDDFIDLAYALNIPLVATNEAFFPNKDMYAAHDALVCIAAGSYVDQTDRRKLTPEHYLKTAAEMRELFKDIPEACDNTLVIAKRCAIKVENIAPILPPFDCGEGRNEEDELRKMSEDGLKLRLQNGVYEEGMTPEQRDEVSKPYWERLDYELGIINQMGFPGYFLIVADFIQWGKEHDIPVGPGRGSGAGSLVAYALTITDLDPLKYALLFERFLNPERVSMPDFDIDFCQDRREEVIKYVQDKYGYDHVAQIITFGKLQARAVLRDTGRVLQMPFGQVDRICKYVPNDPGKALSVEQALEQIPEFKQEVEDDETVSRMVDIAKQLEGLYRHASTHAAGVVIGDRPLDKLVPLYRDPKSDMPVTQFNMKFVEQAGLVKFDFLGLKTLTVISTALQFINEDRETPLDISRIPLDDKPTYEMLGRGEGGGVFQLESEGMRGVLRSMKPNRLEDLIAVVALYRPGPMDNIPSYIKRKHGQEEPDYLYPTIEPILKETYGIMIYQEQVMQIAQVMAGYSLGGADLLRRAMGKKIAEEMEKQRKMFVDGSVERGVPQKKADEIFDIMAKFASYGFNKSHAAAYAYVAYQTAYLKANYPAEFMAGIMSLDLNNTDKLDLFKKELARMKIPLLQPDINKSNVIFGVEEIPNPNEDVGGTIKAVRYALSAIRNVGDAAMESVVAERTANGPFKDPFDFANRVDNKGVNKRILENLVRAGAFDAINSNRRQVFDGIETLIKHSNLAAEERNSDQMGMFGADDSAMKKAAQLPNVPDWPGMERLSQERSAIGFYLSAHPLDTYSKTLQRLGVKSYSDIVQAGISGPVKIAGTVGVKREKISQKGNRFAFVTLSDSSGDYEIAVFSEALSACRDYLEPGQSVFIMASAQFEEENVRFIANNVDLLDVKAARATAGLKIFIEDITAVSLMKELLEREGKGKGNVTVMARIDATTEAEINLKEGYRITPGLLQAVKAVPGIADVQEI